jgi:hypothetical protein
MKTVFILGAGFSAAANSYLRLDELPDAKPYPLVGDIGRECFGPGYDLTQGVENSFAEAMARNDPVPVNNLVDLIQTADHYVGRHAADDDQSIFLSLVRAFPGVAFLTFNYDSLLELVLVRRNLWTPYDGFGAQAQADLMFQGRTERCYQKSTIRVLHLHGSLCLYAKEWDVDRKQGDPIAEFKLKELPEFIFDPNALAKDFHSGDCYYYMKGQQDLSYCLPYERVIVPVPSKAPSLMQGFIQEIYKAAEQLLAKAERLIAIGYRFSECDLDSYERLLRSFAIIEGNPAFIINRSAQDIVQRMKYRYPKIAWFPVSSTFEMWAAGGFKAGSADRRQRRGRITERIFLDS